MKTVEEIVREARKARAATPDERFVRMQNRFLSEIAEKGYFTVASPDPSLSDAPYSVLMHPLPHPGQENMLHNHATFELAYVYRGSCRNLRQGYEVELRQGDLLLMNPDAIHCMCTDRDDDVVFNFLIPPSVLDNTFLRMLADNPISDFFINYMYQSRTGPDFLIINGGADDGLDNVIERLIIEYHEKRPGYQSVMQAGLVQLFVYMSRRYADHLQDLPIDETSRLMRSILLYIGKFTSTVTLAETARAFSYNEKYISRLIKREMGMSFTQLVRRQRLQNASELLLKTSMSVEEVAHEVGYLNLTHFYELFQDRYAMTPAAYRAARKLA